MMNGLVIEIAAIKEKGGALHKSSGVMWCTFERWSWYGKGKEWKENRG